MQHVIQAASIDVAVAVAVVVATVVVAVAVERMRINGNSNDNGEIVLLLEGETPSGQFALSIASTGRGDVGQVGVSL